MDWRKLLGNIITNNVAERDRIAREIGIHPITLMRWVSGDSSPRPHNLRQLLRALPKAQRMPLLSALNAVFTDISDFEDDMLSREVPYQFIMDVLEAHATIPDTLRYWSISQLVLQQALRELDPERVGMSATIVRCMPLRDGKIRSLRESLGVGTEPWVSDFEEKAFLLGAESLAGHVTVSCRMEQIYNTHTNTMFLPVEPVGYEKSAVACPIMYANRVAGCLLILSTQPKYFLLESRLALVRTYAQLLALAFHPTDFYDPELLALHIMPSFAVQTKYFTDFRLRVLRLMQESNKNERRLTNFEVEQQVWQDIEAALLALPLDV